MFLPPLARRTLLLAAALAAARALHAQGVAPTPPRPAPAAATQLHADTVVRIAADGSTVREVRGARRLHNAEAVRTGSQISLAWQEDRSRIEILEAYTMTAEGRRVEVGEAGIRDQQEPQSSGAPMFSDMRVKTVVFPATAPGASTHIAYRRTETQPQFAGHYAGGTVFDMPLAHVQSSTLTVHAPAATVLQTQVRGRVTGGRVTEGVPPGEQLWRWSVRDLPPPVLEAGAPHLADTGNAVFFSTFADYADVGRAYLQGAAGQAAVTPAIAEHAEALTHGIADRRAQADALYRWVAQNIRYVAIYLGNGGVVPHAAADVLANRYGDCKDHVVLLEALLAAKGIPSHPVLVNATNIYTVPLQAPTSTGNFNHLITYLPEWDLFVDSTARLARFGVLPPQQLGKPALVADAAGARLVTLPVGNRDRVGSDTRVELRVAGDGTVTGTADTAYRGTTDFVARSTFARLAPDQGATMAGQWLAGSGQSGSGNVARGNVDDLAQPYANRTEFTLPAYATLPGPGALVLPAGITSINTIASSVGAANLPPRATPIVYTGGRITEQVRVLLPPGLAVAQLPAAADIRSPYGHYQAAWQRDGDALVLNRSLDVDHPKPVLSAEEFTAAQRFMQQVQRHLRAPLIY